MGVTYDHAAEVERTRKMWLKRKLYMVKPLTLSSNGLKNWAVMLKPNKTQAIYGLLHESCGTWNVVKQLAHYQAPGHKGRIVGYWFDKGHDLSDYHETLLVDLYNLAHKNECPYPIFDQNLLTWE